MNQRTPKRSVSLRRTSAMVASRIDLVGQNVERLDDLPDAPVVLWRRHDDERVLGVVDADLVAVVVETDRGRGSRRLAVRAGARHAQAAKCLLGEPGAAARSPPESSTAAGAAAARAAQCPPPEPLAPAPVGPEAERAPSGLVRRRRRRQHAAAVARGQRRLSEARRNIGIGLLALRAEDGGEDDHQLLGGAVLDAVGEELLLAVLGARVELLESRRARARDIAAATKSRESTTDACCR